jgi:hypothetical protein
MVLPVNRVRTFSGVMTPARAAALRAHVDPLLGPFHVPDRGRYLVAELGAEVGPGAGVGPEPELVAALASFAATQLGLAGARVVTIRATRLAHGDYALTKDDQRRWQPDHDLDLTLDFSAGDSEEAQVVYHTAEVQTVCAQRAGSAILADRRGGGTVRWERYLNQRVGEAQIYRLRVALVVIT